MAETFAFLLMGGAPLLLAVLASLLVLRRGDLIERTDWRAVAVQVVVFGLISWIGAGIRGPKVRDLYIDAALFVVVVAGLQGGLRVGVCAGLIGALARLLSRNSAPFAFITLLAGTLAGTLRRRWPRPPEPGKGFLVGAGIGAMQVVLTCITLGASPLDKNVIAAYFPFMLMTGAWVAVLGLILNGLRGEIERHRLERLAAEARLALLQSQIRPHFLFNALNTISAVSRTDPEETRRLIQSLAEFLRLSLKTANAPIPVEEELSHLAPYLEIERARFGERLRVAQRVTQAARAARIPPLTLQPLVENAIRHGFRDDGRPLTVLIEGDREGDRVLVRVVDDGNGMEGPPEGDGIGLANVQERVAAHCGKEAFHVKSEPGTGTTIEIRLPAGGA